MPTHRAVCSQAFFSACLSLCDALIGQEGQQEAASCCRNQQQGHRNAPGRQPCNAPARPSPSLPTSPLPLPYFPRMLATTTTAKVLPFYSMRCSNITMPLPPLLPQDAGHHHAICGGRLVAVVPPYGTAAPRRHVPARGRRTHSGAGASGVQHVVRTALTTTGSYSRLGDHRIPRPRAVFHVYHNMLSVYQHHAISTDEPCCAMVDP